jgi:hypothetical protein
VINTKSRDLIVDRLYQFIIQYSRETTNGLQKQLPSPVSPYRSNHELSTTNNKSQLLGLNSVSVDLEQP